MSSPANCWLNVAQVLGNCQSSSAHQRPRRRTSRLTFASIYVTTSLMKPGPTEPDSERRTIEGGVETAEDKGKIAARGGGHEDPGWLEQREGNCPRAVD